MIHDKHTLVGFLRMSVGNLVKIERMLKPHSDPDHRSMNEFQFEEITEELSNNITEIVQATSKCFNTCKDLRDKDFGKHLKL